MTSNFPPVHSLICRAVFSTSRTSALTGTGRTPASRLTRETSLSGIHVLINCSRRVNSANTSSNAGFAAGSSAVHAVRMSVEPIERRDAETSLAGLKPCATEEVFCATEDGSLCAQPSAAVHARATEIIRYRNKNDVHHLASDFDSLHSDPLSQQGGVMAKAAKSVPNGFHTVTAHLMLDDAAQAIEWYRAFGAEEIGRHLGPDGKIMHAELKIGDSRIIMNDVMHGMKGPKGTAGLPRRSGCMSTTPTRCSIARSAPARTCRYRWAISSGAIGAAR